MRAVYGLRSDPLWRLLLILGMPLMSGNTECFPDRRRVAFSEANRAGESPDQRVKLGPAVDRTEPFPLLGRICGERAILRLSRCPIDARRLRYLVFGSAFF